MAPKVLLGGEFPYLSARSPRPGKAEIKWAHEEAKELFDGIADVTVRLNHLIQKCNL